MIWYNGDGVEISRDTVPPAVTTAGSAEWLAIPLAGPALDHAPNGAKSVRLRVSMSPSASMLLGGVVINNVS